MIYTLKPRDCYAFAVQYYASCGDLEGATFNMLGLLMESIPKRENGALTL